MAPRFRRIRSVEIPLVDRNAVGQRIATVRRSRAWRQVDLAKLVGVKKGTIALWETGIRLPNIGHLIALSIVLRRKLDWLLFGWREIGRRRRKNTGSRK